MTHTKKWQGDGQKLFPLSETKYLIFPPKLCKAKLIESLFFNECFFDAHWVGGGREYLFETHTFCFCLSFLESAISFGKNFRF